MNENRVEDWKQFEGKTIKPGGVTLDDDGRVHLAFEGDSWAVLRPGALGISLTSHVSLRDGVFFGMMTPREACEATDAYEARKERERVAAEQEYRDEMLKRQERLR